MIKNAHQKSVPEFSAPLHTSARSQPTATLLLNFQQQRVSTLKCEHSPTIYCEDLLFVEPHAKYEPLKILVSILHTFKRNSEL